MKVYHVHPLVAAILLCLLGAGALGFFVALPIAFIQWIWNILISGLSCLPTINFWQAALLYLAIATIMYLLGFVRVELEAKPID